MKGLTPMQPATKKSCRQRLTRIEGQVRGVSGMIDRDRYCIDVLTQVQAIRAALKRVEDEVLADHVHHCVDHAIKSGNTAEQRKKVRELLDVLERAR